MKTRKRERHSPQTIPAIVLALLFALLLALSQPQSASAAGDAYDLSNFVESIIIRNASGATVSDGIFMFEETYTFSIKFAEGTGDKQFAYTTVGGKEILQYQLPPALTIHSAVDNGEVRTGSGAVVGWYSINMSGGIAVWFGNYDISGAPSPYNFIDYTDAAFTLDIIATFSETTQIGDIPFGDGASITIKALTQPDLGVMVAKTSTYSPNDETISYSIAITAVGGPDDVPIKNIKLTDVPFIRNGGADPKVSINDASTAAYKEISYNKNGGAEVPMAVEWHANADGAGLRGFSYTFPETLMRGDTITVTYTLVLYDLFRANTSDSSRTHLRYDSYVGNDATALTEGGKTDKATVQDRVIKEFVTKTVSASDGSPTTHIRWTASIGDGTRPLGGEQVTDTINDAISSFPAPTSILIRLYGAPSGGASALFPNGAFDASADLLGEYIADDLGVIIIGRDLYFTIPGIGAKNPYGGTFPAIFRVEIEFETAVSQSSELPYNSTKSYVNIIKYDGTNASAIYNVYGPIPVLPKFPSIKKSSSQIDKNSGGEYFIMYTAEFTVPEGNEYYSYKGENVYFYDELFISTTETVINAPESLSVSIKAADGTLAALRQGMGATDYNVVLDNRTFYIYFGGAGASIWPYDTETTIVVSYSIPLGSKTEEGATIEALLRAAPGRYLRNRSFVHNPINGVPVGPATVYDAWPIHKTSTVNANDEAVFNYSVILNASTFASSKLFEIGAAAIFKDTFETGLEYVPRSLYVVAKPNPASSASWLYFTPSPDAIGGVEQIETGTANTIAVDLSKMYRIYAWGGSVSTSIGFAMPASAEASNADYKFWYTLDCVYEVHYQLRLSDRNASADGSAFTNTATIISTVDRAIGSICDFSSSYEVIYSKEAPLKKTMTENGTNLVEFEVIINPYGRKLLGATAFGEMLTVNDIMSPNLAIYVNSIKMYTKKMAGSIWTDEWVAYDAKAGDEWEINVINASEIEFIIPDNVPVKITYTALVIRPLGETVTIENKVTIEGLTPVGVSGTFTVTKSDAFATANKMELQIYKADSEEEYSRLNGAEFKLYMAIPNGEPYDGDYSRSSIIIGSLVFYEVMDSKPGKDLGKDGIYLFDSAWITPTHSAIYLIIETKAPEGYELPAFPDNYTFLATHALSEEETEVLESMLGSPVSYTADTIFIVNKKAELPPEPPPTEPPPTQPPPTEPPPAQPPPAEPPLVPLDPQKDPPLNPGLFRPPPAADPPISEEPLPPEPAPMDPPPIAPPIPDPSPPPKDPNDDTELGDGPPPLGDLPDTGSFVYLCTCIAILGCVIMGVGFVMKIKYGYDALPEKKPAPEQKE
ncbi:MAG: hypothetical protein FWH33_07740 [Oscillospiraceae bacterium]|nr:hypothetical protein [Oscillospiraceae bacterium]